MIQPIDYPPTPFLPLSRRRLLRRATQVAAVAATAAWWPAQSALAAMNTAPVATKGRLKLSVAQWCFETIEPKWSVEKTCQVAKQLGCKSVELVPVDQYPTVQRYGLVCALAQIDTNPDPPFLKGFNNPDYWPKVIKATEEAIENGAAYGVPNVICFTGFSARNPADPNSPRLTPEEGARNCVAGLKKVIGLAEKKNVTLCLEMLNTRDDTHPMKGHPGYQGDRLDYCLDIIKQVGSPRLKLLFDIYHVQIMEGDIIRHLRQAKDYIGHVHAAGNPGRAEIDDHQEINFPGIMRALVDLGYPAYVGLEFIPTRDRYQSLREAVAICDV